MRYPDEYKCDFTKVIKFERDYKRYIEYRFIGLFPISLNATTVSYEGSQILKATASFNYERYIAGESYSINYARGDDNNKEGQLLEIQVVLQILLIQMTVELHHLPMLLSNLSNLL